MKKIIVQGRPFSGPPSGFRNFSEHFINQLALTQPKYNFEILLPKDIDRSQFSLSPNISFKTITAPTTSPDYFSTLLWENTLAAEYVHEHAGEIAYYFSPYNCLPLQKLPVPEFVVLHDIDLWIDHGVVWPPERRFGYAVKKESIHRADHVFTVSDFSKKQIELFFQLSPEKVTVIYEDIHPYYKNPPVTHSSAVLTTYKLQPQKFYLYVGSNEPRKNVSTLLTAYEKYIRTSSHPLPLVIVGSTNERTNSLSGFVNNEHIIHINQNLSTADLYELYHSAYAFIYPSLYEGFGLQILEAQHSKCPLLVSDIEIFHEIGGEGVVYFNPQDANSIVEGMMGLEKNPQQREDLIIKGAANAQRYSWEKTIYIFINAIQPSLPI